MERQIDINSLNERALQLIIEIFFIELESSIIELESSVIHYMHL